MPPEVKVRLSVEGTPEAIAAFKAVQAQAHSTATASAKSFNLFNKALSGVKTMLVGMLGVFALGKVAQLGREAMDTTERLGNLAEELGTSVEAMSSLSVVATMADSDLETLAGTMGILAKNVDALKNGSPTAVAAFARLGLSARDFAGQDTAQWFETVALKMDRLAAGGSRTAVALALMGRNGRAALPIMKGLADAGGLLGAQSRAERMGVLIDAQTLANIRALGDQTKMLAREASGAALAFMQGFGPSAVQTLQAFTGSVGGMADQFRALGSAVGFVAKLIVPIINEADTIIVHLGYVFFRTAVAWKQLEILVTKGPAAAQRYREIAKAIIDLNEQELVDRISARNAALRSETPAVTSAAGRSSSGEPGGAARADASAAQRLARQKAAIEAELKAVKDGLSLEEEEAKRSYERGRIALDDYYAKRREVVEKGLAAELRALEGERALAQQETDPERRATQLQAVAARAAAAAREAEAQLADITSEETDAINGLTERALEFQRKLLEAQGKTHEARMLDIALEASAYRQLLGQMGLDPALIDRMIEEYKAALIQADQQARRTNNLQDTLGGTLGSWLGSTINQVDSLTDAVVSLGSAIAAAIQQLVAMKIAQAAVSWIPGMGMATGGLVIGPGTGTSDSIPAWLSAGEYVVPARSVQVPGALSVLDGLRRNPVATVQLYRPSVGRFAEGGPVRPLGAGAAQFTGSLTVNLPPGARMEGAQAYLESHDGVRHIIHLLAKNRRAASAALRR